MSPSTRVTTSRNPHARPRPGIVCWRYLLAASLTLGLAAVLQTASADSVIYLNNFNNPSNNLANNSDGIGSGFTAFSLDRALSFFVIDAFETNSCAILATSLIGDQTASLDTINSFNLNGGGTTFELSGVSFSTHTPIPNGGGGAAGAVDRLMWGVSTMAPAGNWLTNGPPGAIPTGFWIQFNSDSLVTGTGQGGWSGTSTLFYKDAGTNVYRLCSWPFDTLKWSSAGPNNFAPTLDVKLTLSGTGWALNITGDTSTNKPISYSGSFASTNYSLQGTTNLVAIHPLLLNGVNSSYWGGFSQDANPGIAMQIDQAKVTQLGTLVVTTPQLSTPEYGFNTNTVLAGEAVTLTSSVTDSAGTPALQWQIEDMSSPGAFTNIPSGNATNVIVDTSGFVGSVKGIRLVATDGATVVNSPVVTLTVNPASAPVVAQDTMPSYENLHVGQPGLLNAAFSGNLPIFYNWQKGPDGSTWTNLPSSTNPTATNNALTIASAQLTDTGYYRLFGSNSVGTSASSPALIAVIPGTPQYLWSAPIPFGGLNADQILTNFPSTNKIAGAMVAINGALPLVVGTSLANITFGANGVSSIGVSGLNGYGTGANTNLTGNANFNTCLNDYVYDNTNHFIAMSNLVVGQTYQVQLFGLDDRTGKTTHLANWQDPADTNNVSLTYKMGDNVYFLGTFVASNTVQVIEQNLVDTNHDGLGNFNCVILRTVGWNPPPYIAYQPQAQTAFVSKNATLFGVAGGDSSLGPITYQWKAGPSGGPYTNLLEGAKYNGTVTTTLTISNVVVADGNSLYVLAASNAGGSVTSAPTVLLVQPTPPAPPAGSYAAVALSNNPVALWMLDETNDPSTGLVRAYDYTGHGHNAIYGTASLNGFNGQQGPQPPTYPGFYAGETALGTVSINSNSIVTLPPLNDTNLATTVVMWIKPNPGETGNYAHGLIGGRNNNVAGQIWQLGYSGSSGDLGYNWNDNAATYNYNSRLAPVQATWNFVAMVITSSNATFYLYYLNSAGQAILSKAVNAAANTTPITMAGGTTVIGSDPYSLASRAFNGSIAGVALYNSALSESQLQTMFAVSVGITGNFPPAFVTQPTNKQGYAGLTVHFSANTSGTPPITNQWQFNGTNLVDGSYGSTMITGSTSNVLTIANVTLTNQGVYNLVLSNSVTWLASSNATLTIVSFPPTNLVGHWLSGAANLQDTSGYSPAGTHDGYGITGAAGTPASTYGFTNDVPPGFTGVSLWLTNGTTAVAISNSSTLDAAYTNTYDGAISNSFTIMFWAKGWPGSWNCWVSKYGDIGATPYSGWQVRNAGNNLSPCFTMRSPGGTVTLGTAVLGNSDDMAATSAFNDGKWHNYVGTYDNIAGSRFLYVDGYLVAAESGNGFYTLATMCHLAIGAQDQPPGNNFARYYNGEIYDVRIYTAALNQEVIWHGPLPEPGPFSGPPVITTGPNGKQLVLTWSFGSLLQATNVAGPWTATGATSPYTNLINMTAPSMFYKLSNP